MQYKGAFPSPPVDITQGFFIPLTIPHVEDWRTEQGPSSPRLSSAGRGGGKPREWGNHNGRMDRILFYLNPVDNMDSF